VLQFPIFCKTTKKEDLSELDETEMGEILEEYYSEVKENMSLQEFQWKAQIDDLLSQDQIPLLKITEFADRAKLIRIEIPFE
jgi:hypothetical protein